MNAFEKGIIKIKGLSINEIRADTGLINRNIIGYEGKYFDVDQQMWIPMFTSKCENRRRRYKAKTDRTAKSGNWKTVTENRHIYPVRWPRF